MNQCKYLKKIDDDNTYIKNILKRLMMIIITSKIFKGIGGNNYIKNNSLNVQNVKLRRYCK